MLIKCRKLYNLKIPSMAKLLDKNKVYIAQTKRAHVKDIIRHLNDYTCQLTTLQDSPHSYLQFQQKNTGELLRFQLSDFLPMGRPTFSFIEDPHGVFLGDRVNSKTTLFKQERSTKRPRQFTEEYPDDSSSEEVVFNEEIKEKVKYKGVISHDEQVNKRARQLILKILQEEPDGNITPGMVRQRLKDDYDEEQTEKFVRMNMEKLCEPSQKNDRRFILLPEYQLFQQDFERKKRKTQ